MSKFNFLFVLATPPIKLKVTYTWGTTNSKPLDKLSQKYWAAVSQSGPIYYTLFFCLEVHTFVLRLLLATASSTNLVRKNQFPELNRHILSFSQ
jgi:hypothetical protein